MTGKAHWLFKAREPDWTRGRYVFQRYDVNANGVGPPLYLYYDQAEAMALREGLKWVNLVTLLAIAAEQETANESVA